MLNSAKLYRCVRTFLLSYGNRGFIGLSMNSQGVIATLNCINSLDLSKDKR